MVKGARVALVTGGGKGIGRAIALALAARGVAVVVMGRTERALGETVGEIANAAGKARHLAGDVLDAGHRATAIARATQELGGLDFVIATAAVTTGGARAIFADALAHVREGGQIVAVVPEPLDPAVTFPPAEALSPGILARTCVCRLEGEDEDVAAARIVSTMLG